jgi:hypothetical protein
MKLFLATLCVLSLSLQAYAAKPACDPNCQGACQFKGAGKCDKKCKSGYVLSAQFTCVAGQTCDTDSKCLRCMDDGSCRLCTSDSKLSSTHQCVAKSAAELNCDRFCTSGCTSSGAGKCDSSCQSGFVIVNNVCKSCDPNCDVASGCSSKGAGKCDTK